MLKRGGDRLMVSRSVGIAASFSDQKIILQQRKEEEEAARGFPTSITH